jgi:hypothetical protein
MKRIDKNAVSLNVNSVASLESTVAALAAG